MKKMIPFALLLLLGAASASATMIEVHNTGVDSSDILVSAGAAASFWSLQSIPSGAIETIGSGTFRYYHPAYDADGPASAWVSMAGSGMASASGIYVYALTIDLTGLDPNTALITGSFWTDNDGFMRLNGGSSVATTGFGDFHNGGTAFTMNSGFLAGLNTIELGVDNGGGPTAFRVNFTSATADPLSEGEGAVPEPATLGLLGAGLLAVGLLRRFKRA